MGMDGQRPFFIEVLILYKNNVLNCGCDGVE